jgi:hypothetical protein
VAAVAVLSVAAVACSSADEGADGDGAAATSTLVPSSDGDTCDDPTGDLDLPVGVGADTPGLSGIDLVSASATVEAEELAVSITTAGPVDEAPAATYVVAQGDPLGALSFELRLVHGTDGWTTTLITWPDQVESRQPLALTPTVDGSTISTSLPLASLPPISMAMQFGATATVGDLIVVDDCSSLSAG